jgi:hypothetical protein
MQKVNEPGQAGKGVFFDAADAHADGVCKVGLLVYGDPAKVDRARVGEEIIAILNEFMLAVSCAGGAS